MSARSSISRLDDHLGFWLRKVSNHVSHSFMARLAGKGVTAAEWVVLREMHGREVASPGELAEGLGFTKGTLSKLADRLLAKELITCRSVTGDKRRQELALTAGGRRLVPVLAALADQNDSEFFSCLSANERRDLKSLLQKITITHRLQTTPVD